MKNVTLSLFAFHRQQYLDDAPDLATSGAEDIWESLTHVSQFLPFEELKPKALKSQLISYEYDKETANYQYQSKGEETRQTEWLTRTGRPIEFTAIPTQSGFELAGNLLPFRLHDTYCLDVTLRPKIEETEIKVEQLTTFKPQVLIDEITADLGKVLILYGDSDAKSQVSLEEAENEAKRWAIALCANTSLQPQFLSKIQLFNCPCFLFESGNVTIIIGLSQPNQLDAQQANDNYGRLRELFWAQKKIAATYQAASQSYENSRKIYSHLEKKIDSFEDIVDKSAVQRLKRLESLVKEIPQDLLIYNRCLRDLEAHKITIEVNIKIFEKHLNHLSEPPKNNLEFWLNLTKTKYQQYLDQIKIYLAYLKPSQDFLFSEFNSTIRTVNEIEKAKSNQDVQDNLQALGVGLTLGGVAAGRSGLLTEPWSWKGETVELELPFPPFLVAMFLGSLFASLGYLGTRCLIKRKRSPTPKSRKID